MPPARPSKATKAKSTKKLTKPASENAKEETNQPTVPLGLQQKCLDIFRDALKPDEQDQATVQEVKGHLYNRDFAAAFGKEEYLQVYASRWSPSRALGYLQVFRDVQELVLQDESAKPGAFKVLCVGGGAGAEHAALAGWVHHLRESVPVFKVDARLLDIASWDSVVTNLQKSITSAPELSKYASAAAKEANIALLSEDALFVTFTKQDALDWPPSEVVSAVQTVNLVTLMFTLNELYTMSLPKAQALLKTLSSSMQPGSFLLVVDSPGSYSTVSINGAEKKYPMKWLLDLTLLGPLTGRGDEEDGQVVWKKVMEDGSRWFRLSEGLRYPIELENMRFQIHVYKKM
ncbi:putative SAM-dependent methyltransferase [Teratosphaeria destructans]|uniref:SAM-dependent methyltransferase n=1 Tax=Teratosphaeria destructans TaxID=418781 RepID=A0A9W7SPD0_9PEZI|nr:putative SAM-dependent methyltransferase [Teratosphaeria destructans]